MKVEVNRRFIPEELRDKVLARCKNAQGEPCCVKCGSTRQLEIDHIIPFENGGKTDTMETPESESNLQGLCKKCNIEGRTANGSNTKLLEDNLTPKQRNFCKEYMIDSNGTQAAIRAGYSPDSARDIACENLTKPNVAAYIARLTDELNIERDLTTGFILNGLKNIAITGQRDADKVRSFELLGKHRRLFADQIDITATTKIIKEEIRHKEE